MAGSDPFQLLAEVTRRRIIFLQAVRDPQITSHDVARVLESFSCFEQGPDRVGVNPFTKDKVICSGEGKAIYMIDGKPEGNFSLENGRLLFTGIPETVCRDVAELIGAELAPWDCS